MGDAAQAHRYLAVDYPMGPGMPALRRVYQVSADRSTRVDAEWHGREVACRWVPSRDVPGPPAGPSLGKWSYHGGSTPPVEVLDAAPVVNRPAAPPPPPPPREVLLVDASTWTQLGDRRARLKALCAWTKVPGALQTAPLDARQAERVRAVARDLGVDVETVDVDESAGAGAA